MRIIEILETRLKRYEKIIPIRFLLFLIVGGVNTLFGYGIFALCIFFKFHYAFASVVSTVLGVLFNFKTTGIIVFKNKDNTLLFKFFMVYAISFIIGLIYLYYMNQLNISNYLSGAIWILPGASIAYTLQRIFVFKPKKTSAL